jgi:GTP-binding protein Era
MEITKNAMITIAGRPNVGKSTLTNALVGEKVAIVSNKPQTTRNRITAILNRGATQFVFMDTPGFHRARTKLGEYMDTVVRESVADVDAVVLVVEPIPSVGPQEEELIGRIKANGMPAVLVINKIDTVPKQELLGVISAYAAAADFAGIVPVSAKTGEGLGVLLDVLENLAEEGPQLFPEDMITDQPEKQICAELVREKLLWCLEKEVPHGTAVEVTKFSERDDGIIDMDVTIYCEKASHKGIIIGKKGAMLKQIGEMARKDIEAFMGTKVFLTTWVKVKENWRDNMPLLRNFGFSNNNFHR